MNALTALKPTVSGEVSSSLYFNIDGPLSKQEILPLSGRRVGSTRHHCTTMQSNATVQAVLWFLSASHELKISPVSRMLKTFVRAAWPRFPCAPNKMHYCRYTRIILPVVIHRAKLCNPHRWFSLQIGSSEPSVAITRSP